MGNLFNSLNKLKTNIFGGKGNTGFTKPPATRVAKLGIKDTPTSLLDVDPLSFASFSYPRDVTNNVQNGHYMLFYVNVQNRSKFEYTNPQGESVSTVKQVRVQEGPPSGGKSKVVDVKGESQAVKGYYGKRRKIATGNYTTGMDGLASGERKRADSSIGGGVGAKANTTTRISDSVAIYLPPNVSDSVDAVYNDEMTGMIGYAAAAALDFSGAVGAKDYEAAAKALTGGMAGIVTEGAKKAGAALAETLAGAEGAAAVVNRAFGQADNPYMEVLFSNMNVRTFTYNFTFAPRNEEETADVQAIIQLFRFHMAPELQGAQSRFLTLPSEFDIHYMFIAKDGTNSENDYYNKISTCVLTNVSTNYTPNGVRSFSDGAPTQITMSLTFKETTTLTKDRINEGY